MTERAVRTVPTEKAAGKAALGPPPARVNPVPQTRGAAMNEPDLAAWWCDLNAMRWPADLPHPPTWARMTTVERIAATAGAWRVVDALANAAGRQLWRQRYDAGEPVATGERVSLEEGAR
jgi:hypothetical protein